MSLSEATLTIALILCRS